MAEQISVDRLEAKYLPNGFSTQLGKVTPFYGKAEQFVVAGDAWLTPQEARHAAAALLTVAEALDTAATQERQRED